MSDNKPLRWVYFIVALVILGVMGFLLYITVKAYISILSNLEEGVAAAIIAATATILISVLSIIISQQYERTTKVKEEHRQKKIPVYEELMDFLFKTFYDRKNSDQESITEKTREFMEQFTPKLIVWGSDEVIAAYLRFKKLAVDSVAAVGAKTLISSIIQLEELFYTIRRDLGHKNRNLKKLDILKLFINDLPETDKS